MWRAAFILLAVVAATRADEAPAGTPFAGFRAAAEPRLGASGIRIAVLDKHIADVEKEIEEAAKIHPKAFVSEMNWHLDDHETPVCQDPKHDIQCGRDSVECISSLMLCDGTADCHNGWDEDEDVCSPGPIKPGNVFTGTATWHRCITRHEHPVQVRISGVYRAKFFGARLIVRANVGLDFIEEEGRHRDFLAKGYYIFGQKSLVLVPQDPQRSKEKLGVVCHFHLGDDERADCHIVHEATLSECASFRAVLKH